MMMVSIERKIREGPKQCGSNVHRQRRSTFGAYQYLLGRYVCLLFWEY